MASNRAVPRVSFSFLLSLVRCALASPTGTPRISSPEMGALSFTDLALQTFRRILELGFLQGVISSLLILSCLVFLTVCILYALAAFLSRNDTRLCDERDELGEGNFEDNELSAPRGEKAESAAYRFRFQPRGRSPRRGLPRHYHPWIPKLQIHSPPSRQRLTTPTKPRARSSHPQSPSRFPPPPLRSALSKSPPAMRHLPRIQSLFVTPTRTSPTTSPKSVRWADEIQVAVLELSFQWPNAKADTGSEMDIGLSRTNGLDETVFGGFSNAPHVDTRRPASPSPQAPAATPMM